MTLQLVCGVDEAGRGPLAGAVYAAAVILDPARPILGLNDSKKLSEKKRDRLAIEIKQYALAWAIASSSVEEIDEINILQASLLAMKRAVEGLQHMPHLIQVDGLHCPQVSIPAQAIVQGDSKVEAIAAASILAKVARDEMMRECDLRYPGYGLAHNMGYASEDHREAIRRLGPSEIHRRSFHGTQRWLFC